MKNNRVVILFLLAFCVLNGQSFNVNFWGSSTYIDLSSYYDTTINNSLALKLDGNGNINSQNWKVSFSINNLNSDSGSYTFPSDKISIIPNTVTGQANPNNIPSFSEIGALSSVSFMAENQEYFIIPSSASPIYNESDSNAYYYYQLSFNVMIAGGAYRANYPAWTKFHPVITVNVYDGNNILIGSQNVTLEIQISNLTGAIPAENSLSLSLNSDASNATISLNTLSDYTNGKSITYSEGATVNTNVAYSVTVKSTQPYLTASNGDTLPLETVQILLVPNSDTTASTTEIELSVIFPFLVTLKSRVFC